MRDRGRSPLPRTRSAARGRDACPPEPAYAVGHLGGRCGRTLDDDRKFLASDPEDLVLGSHDAHEDAPHRAEDLVAGKVPVPVVDLLEVVEIEDDEGKPRRLVLRVVQSLLEMLVEGALVGETRQGVAPRLGMRERETALVGECLGGEIGHSRDQLGVSEGLDARRKRHEHGAESLRAGDQRSCDRLSTRRPEPVQLTQLVRVRLDEAELRIRAGNDVRRRVQRLGRVRPRHRGEGREILRGRRDRSPRTPPGEIGDLAGNEIGGPAAVHGAGDQIGESDERLARARECPLEAPPAGGSP